MNITCNSTICSLLKNIRNEIYIRRNGNPVFLCNKIISILTDLIENYIKGTEHETKVDSPYLYWCVKSNLNKFIPEFNRYYAEKLGFITDYENVWFNNNKERIEFLDNLINIYKDKRTTIKTLIKQFIKSYG